jgi:LysM repeat protein
VRTATRMLTNLSVGALATGVVLAGAPVTSTAPTADAAELQLMSGRPGKLVGHGAERRRVVRYVVTPGDTAIGLAVRFHAWTSELLALNHLSYHSRLQVGQRLRIPVVPRRLRDGAPAQAPKPKHHKMKHRPQAWQHADPSRAKVARVIARTAHRYGVDRELALAVSWQESGWQMHHVSSAGAIGAMQVLRTTGAWMSLYVGRPLHLHRLHDNAAAGAMLLKVLRQQTHSQRRTVAAYYQGLGAVRRHGLYEETRSYVADVLAIKRNLENGRNPG